MRSCFPHFTTTSSFNTTNIATICQFSPTLQQCVYTYKQHPHLCKYHVRTYVCVWDCCTVCMSIHSRGLCCILGCSHSDQLTTIVHALMIVVRTDPRSCFIREHCASAFIEDICRHLCYGVCRQADATWRPSCCVPYSILCSRSGFRSRRCSDRPALDI